MPQPGGAQVNAGMRTDKIFVGGLQLSCDESKLIKCFQKYGTVIDASIVKDPESGRPRGFAFVRFDNMESASEVLKHYATHQIDGKWCEVKKAVSCDSTPSVSVNANLIPSPVGPVGNVTHVPAYAGMIPAGHMPMIPAGHMPIYGSAGVAAAAANLNLAGMQAGGPNQPGGAAASQAMRLAATSISGVPGVPRQLPNPYARYVAYREDWKDGSSKFSELGPVKNRAAPY